MDKISEKTYNVTNDIIVALGYEIVDIEYKSMYNEYNLTIFIHKKGGISLSDCEAVTKGIEVALEEADVTQGAPYNLNISSTGLDRLIVTSDDYRRSLDTEVEIILAKPTGKRIPKGMLINYDETTLTIKNKDKIETYNKIDCTKVRPYINFK